MTLKLMLKSRVSLFVLAAVLSVGPSAWAGGVHCKQCPAESEHCIPRGDCPEAVEGNGAACSQDQSSMIESDRSDGTIQSSS